MPCKCCCSLFVVIIIIIAALFFPHFQGCWHALLCCAVPIQLLNLNCIFVLFVSSQHINIIVEDPLFFGSSPDLYIVYTHYVPLRKSPVYYRLFCSSPFCSTTYYYGDHWCLTQQHSVYNKQPLLLSSTIIIIHTHTTTETI